LRAERTGEQRCRCSRHKGTARKKWNYHAEALKFFRNERSCAANSGSVNQGGSRLPRCFRGRVRARLQAHPQRRSRERACAPISRGVIGNPAEQFAESPSPMSPLPRGERRTPSRRARPGSLSASARGCGGRRRQARQGELAGRGQGRGGLLLRHSTGFGITPC
jgi:hypothetical protein